MRFLMAILAASPSPSGTVRASLGATPVGPTSVLNGVLKDPLVFVLVGLAVLVILLVVVQQLMSRREIKELEAVEKAPDSVVDEGPPAERQIYSPKPSQLYPPPGGGEVAEPPPPMPPVGAGGFPSADDAWNPPAYDAPAPYEPPVAPAWPEPEPPARSAPLIQLPPSSPPMPPAASPIPMPPPAAPEETPAPILPPFQAETPAPPAAPETFRPLPFEPAAPASPPASAVPAAPSDPAAPFELAAPFEPASAGFGETAPEAPEPPRYEPPPYTPPAVQPPAIEPSAVEPVAIEPVAIEPLAAEPPAVEAPVAEAPVMETPVAETPVAETPVAETPVVEAAVPHDAPTLPGPPEDEGAGAQTILLIEDDERIAKFYTILFQAKGFTVENARDGVEGVDMATALKPALILLDVMMPKMNGLMVLQTLRANPETEATPVVVLSNYMEPPLIQRALQLGAIEYVVKSQARPEQLVNALPQWLQGKPAIH